MEREFIPYRPPTSELLAETTADSSKTTSGPSTARKPVSLHHQTIRLCAGSIAPGRNWLCTGPLEDSGCPVALLFVGAACSCRWIFSDCALTYMCSQAGMLPTKRSVEVAWGTTKTFPTLRLATELLRFAYRRKNRRSGAWVAISGTRSPPESSANVSDGEYIQFGSHVE